MNDVAVYRPLLCLLCVLAAPVVANEQPLGSLQRFDASAGQRFAYRRPLWTTIRSNPLRPVASPSEGSETIDHDATPRAVRLPEVVHEPPSPSVQPEGLRAVMTRLPETRADAEQPDQAPEDAAVAIDEKALDELTTDIRPPSGGELPKDEAEAVFAEAGQVWHLPGIGRDWAENDVQWEATALGHRPLYFEDINLERHGHKARFVQPLMSAAHFYGRIPALPYLMTLERPHECVYPLGYHRPGDAVPCPIRRVPVTIGPSLVEAAAVTGLIFLIP